MFDLFHCVLQLEIKTIKFYFEIMELQWENQVLFISTMFHWTCAKYN